MLFSLLDNENTRDKAKGLCVISEKYIGELGARCLRTLNREDRTRGNSLLYRPDEQPI